MRYFMCLLVSLFMASPVYGETFQPTPTKTVVMNGNVDARYFVLAGSVLQLTLAGYHGNLDFILNSDGGSVEMGAEFIKSIEFAKARGINVRCLNTGHVASMAFMIFMHCSERYAVKGATYLFHYPKNIVFGPLSKDQMSQGYWQLLKVENAFVKDIQDHLKLTEQVVRFNCARETWWTNESINNLTPNFVKLVDGIAGTPLTEPGK